MNYNLVLLGILSLMLINCFKLSGQTGTEGYYKDVFMDGGTELTSRTSLAAANSLGMSLEYIATEDSAIQNTLIRGNSNDINGVLLYPDGEPRFRSVQTNGGAATAHGRSLTEQGRQRIRDFYYNGGSYTGNCAGAFITSIHFENTDTNSNYYHIWPGRTVSTGLLDSYTGHHVVAGSPLLQYNDFGGDNYVDFVYHNGGCYTNETYDYPAETEILLLYDYPGYTMDDKTSAWAHKKDTASGRIVVMGSHPEGVTSGERLELMKALIQYAQAGNGEHTTKAELLNGVARVMDKETHDNDPFFTKIGDKQYHHFEINLPSGASELTLALNGESGYDFNVYISKDSLAFQSTALYMDTLSGNNKILSTGSIPAGIWYVSIMCATTVSVTEQIWGSEYSGNLGVLNGVEYTIKADWAITNEPITNFYSDVIETCNGHVNFTDFSTGNPEVWNWDFGDGSISSIPSPSHEYFESGIYTVTLITINSYGSDTLQITDMISVLRPDAPVFDNVGYCGSNQFNLAASASGSAFWFEDNFDEIPISEGPIFTTPVLDTSTTYYVENVAYHDPVYLGRTTQSGNGGFYDGTPQSLVFDVYKELTILSVMVWANGSGSRIIELHDYQDSVLLSENIYCLDGESRISLNFVVSPGTDYKLVGPDGASLYRDFASDSIDYPYTAPGLLAITGSSFSTNYYYFYDWEVQDMEACRSARIPLHITIDEAIPTAQFSYTDTELSVSFTNMTEGNNTYHWDFGDGATSSELNPVHEYSNSGTYTVTLVATNECGTDIYSEDLVVVLTGSSELKSESQYYIYPNPNNGSFVLRFANDMNSLTLRLLDINGKMIFEKEIQGKTFEYDNRDNLQKGIYFISIEAVPAGRQGENYHEYVRMVVI